MSNKFVYGQPVQKTRGYKFPGIVVAVFTNLAYETRYVVECTVEGVEGCLHIYSERDLEPRDVNTN